MNEPLSLKCDCKNSIFAIPTHYGIGRCPYCQKKWYFVECPECKTVDVLRFMKEPAEKNFMCVSCENTYPIPADIESIEIQIQKKEHLSQEQLNQVKSTNLKTKLIAITTLIAAIALLWLFFSIR